MNPVAERVAEGIQRNRYDKYFQHDGLDTPKPLAGKRLIPAKKAKWLSKVQNQKLLL